MLEQYHPAIAIMILVLNVLSALALLFVMIIYITGWKTINSFPMRLVFYLCLACFIQNLYVFMLGPFRIHDRSTANINTTDPYCTTMAVIKTGADLSSVIWTFILTYSAYITVVRGVPIEKREWIFVLLGYLLPFGLAAIPVAMNVYGYTDYFCWFIEKNAAVPIVTSIFFYYLPLWAFFVANTVMFQRTYRKLKELEMDPHQLRIFKRLLLFPLILFVVALFSTIHRIVLFFGDDVVALAVLDYFFSGSYGLMNALAYGFNPTIREYMNRLICKKCLKQKDRASSTASDTQRVDKQIFLAELTQ